MISIQHVGLDTSFYLNVKKPPTEFQSNTPMKTLHVEWFPLNASQLHPNKMDIGSDVIIKTAEGWVNVLKQYQEIDLNRFIGDFTRTYAKETFEEFKILDEDADSAPFDEPRGLFWHRYLSYVVEELKKEENPESPEIQEMISDVNILNNNIESLTKNEVLSWYSKCIGKAKKHGTKFALDILDVAKKEAIKYYLKAAHSELPSLMKEIHEFMNLPHHVLLS